MVLSLDCLNPRFSAGALSAYLRRANEAVTAENGRAEIKRRQARVRAASDKKRGTDPCLSTSGSRFVSGDRHTMPTGQRGQMRMFEKRISAQILSGRVTAVVACIGLSLAVIAPFSSPVQAQDKKEAAPAPKAEAKNEDPRNKKSWFKICAKVPIGNKAKPEDKDKKKEPEKKNACTTFYESFNPATGAPLVYVAIEQGEGIKNKVLTVVVPTGLALPPGLAITVFQKDQWDKFLAQSKEGKTVKPEDIGLKPIELKYLHCHATGCASVSEAADDFIAQMKTGVGLMVRAVELSNKVVDFPVPLKGFTDAHEGKAEDTKDFMAFRANRLKQLEAKRRQMIEQFKKDKAELMKDAPENQKKKQ